MPLLSVFFHDPDSQEISDSFAMTFSPDNDPYTKFDYLKTTPYISPSQA